AEGHGTVATEPVVMPSTSAGGGAFAAAGDVTMVTRTGTGPSARAASFLLAGSRPALPGDAKLCLSATIAGISVAAAGSVASATDCEVPLTGHAASMRDLGVAACASAAELGAGRPSLRAGSIEKTAAPRAIGGNSSAQALTPSWAQMFC